MKPPRIVLDTNVCLDLFVFEDARWQRLRAALESKQWQAVTSEHCRAEWQAVLQYPHLPLDAMRRTSCKVQFDNLISCLSAAQMQAMPVQLPRCSDRDDQKFLQLAYDSGAVCLISKDKALLKLARKTARAGLFAIMTPERWLATYLPEPSFANIDA